MEFIQGRREGFPKNQKAFIDDPARNYDKKKRLMRWMKLKSKPKAEAKPSCCEDEEKYRERQL